MVKSIQKFNHSFTPKNLISTKKTTKRFKKMLRRFNQNV